MLNRLLFILALVSQLLACGSDQADDKAASPAVKPMPAKYPRSMPQSTLDDSRLIGYWETSCNESGKDSSRWTFLLDPTKAVLEKQVYRTGKCQEALYTVRYYLTYKVEAENLDGRIWEVHANIQAQDRLSTLFNLQNCALPNALDELWYNLTGTECTINELPGSVERGTSLIDSHYSISFNKQQPVLNIEGKSDLKFNQVN